MTVSELMRADVVTAAPETPVSDIATEMRDSNVGSVVVVDEAAPVGVVTDRDVAVRVAAERLDAGDLTAADVMTEDPATVPVGTGIFEVSEAMNDAGVRRMPVVDDGELVGIVTMDDMNVLLVGELDNLTDVVSGESPPY